MIFALVSLLTFSLAVSLALKSYVNYGSIKPPIDIVANKQPGGEYGIRQLDIKGMLFNFHVILYVKIMIMNMITIVIMIYIIHTIIILRLL